MPGRVENIDSGQGSAALGLRAWFTWCGAHILLLLLAMLKTLETQILQALNKLSDCLKNVAHEANLTRSNEATDCRWRALRWWWWIYRKGLANGGAAMTDSMLLVSKKGVKSLALVLTPKETKTVTLPSGVWCQ